MDEPPPLPKHIVWFAPWDWTSWPRIIVTGIVVAGVLVVLGAFVLRWLAPFDLYLNDTYFIHIEPGRN